MKNNHNQYTFSKQTNNLKLVKYSLGTVLFGATIGFIYYNVMYMNDLAAKRIERFEQKSGMKVTEYKTENPIPEEIRPEYIEKQKRKYRQIMLEKRQQNEQ